MFTITFSANALAAAQGIFGWARLLAEERRDAYAERLLVEADDLLRILLSQDLPQTRSLELLSFHHEIVIVDSSTNFLTVPETFRYRSHRPGGPAPTRQIDDGQNPLLVRGGGPRRPEVQRASLGSWISTVGPPGAAEVSSFSFFCIVP